MAEEAKGQKFSQRTGGLLDKVTGNQGTQQTQQTQQDTSGQQATGGIFLPGISGTQNNVSTANGFSQGIQDGTIKSNIVLPGITSKPNEATLDTTTMKQKRQSYIYAKNNNIDTNSINEQIEEERTGSNKVLGQTGKILKTYRETPVNSIKKWGVRAIADSGLPGYFVDKTLEKAGAPDGIGDNIKDAVNETARKVAITYQNKVNEDFQEKVNKNIDPKIREKYDNESITDLIGKGDGAGARYKIWKGTVENWNMIPEIGLMFVNPYIGLATMGTDVYIQENQGTFEDMLQNGATYEQARNGAVAVGILNAGIELFMERFLGGAKWAGATALRRLFLKNAQREVVKQATKKGMAEIFARGVSERLKGSMVEGFEEVLQQIVGNIMVKMVNPDRDITEGTRESFEGGFYNLFNGIGGATNIANEFKQNEQIQKQADIEALKYVMEGEQRKAQRMAKEQARAKFLERLKNPTMDNGYTPTQEEAEQRAREKEENEQFEDEMKIENQEGPNYTEEDEQRFTREGIEEQQQADELRTEQNREMQIENDMINEVLNEGDLNEDLGDPRYQKSDSPQSVSEDTVREKSRTGKISISPENSSEISKNLNEIKKNLEDLKADTFLQQIKKSISGDEKNSNYITNRINGNKYVLRIADHHANAKNSKRHPTNNTSIVIKLVKRKNNGRGIQFKKYKSVDMEEFVYDPANMTTEKMQGIIDGIQNWIKTGEYTDTNYDSKNKSTRKQGDTKYQLKYEEKGYKPGVAGKNEKSISGKEGVNLRSKLNKQTIKQLAEKYGIKVEVIEGMIEIIENRVKKGEAYGKYIDQVLTLSEQIKESTAPHELLHAIFDMIDPETKAYLISQVMQSEGWSAKQAEEWLADSFSNFFRTGKIEGAPKSTWGKIKIFFKRVRSFINGMGKWRSQLEEIFTDIIESEGIEDLQGKIDQSKSLNEAKEKMRKRFLEYSKNAQKTQNKVKKSEAKYQEAEDQTKSKAFKKRFGDSKVVDENGNPLVVYHGTERKFNTFGRGNGEHGKGFYFTDDMDYAEEFSGEDGNTMEVYLKIVKPLRENVDMNSPEMKNFIKGIKNKRGLSEKQIKDCFVNEDWSSELSSKIAKKMGYGKKDVEKTVGWEFEDIDEIGETDYNAYLGAYAWENGLNDLVRESGFDGIISKIYNSDAEGLEYIVFKPSQVKSATDNKGTFDANNDDIRYQTVDGSEREVKANIIQDPVKGKMYHVTTEEFENFRESDEYDDDDRRDWNDSFGTYVTDAEQFFEDFTQTSPRDNGSGWKKFEIDVDIKKPVLHPYRTWKQFGMEKADEMIIDYLQLVDRFTPEVQKELVALKNMSLETETQEEFDYDNYPFKDSYTKDEILEMPGSISSAILDAQFIGESEETINFLFGDDASRDREYLKKKGYDAIMIYEGEKDGPIFSYALFYPNRYTKKNLGIKYQEAEDIDPNIQSPNEMLHDWGGLMVIDKFISEEQKKKAYDVSKNILVHDGGKWDGHPYMWMHTNKYSSKMIPNFENTKDNRYKEFSDKGIVVSFFTNNDDMSKSYADQRSVLANTKKFKSIEEFNKMFRDDSNWTTSEISGDPIKTIFETKIVKDGDEYVIHKINEDLHKYTSIDDMYKKFMPRDRKEGLSDSEKIQAVKKYAKDNFMGEDFSLYDGIDINKDGKDIVVRLRSDNELGRYKTEKQALANARSLVNKEGQYHYKGIIQNMHNPLVIDKKVYGDTTPNWNRLGNAYDFLEKTDKEQLTKLVDAIDDVYNRQVKLGKEWNKLSKRSEKLRDAMTEELNDNRMDNFNAKANKDENEIARTNHKESEIWDKREKFDSIIEKLELALHKYYDLTDTAKEVMESYLNQYNIKEWRSLYNDYMKLIDKYKEFYSLDGGEKFEAFAKKNYGVNDATLSLLHGIEGVTSDNGEKILKDKWMQTNDFVFYALRKGGYDGVIFGRINDYGGKSIRGRIGGNVLVTFKPNQFKSWDNADPTDSEFISYQKMDDEYEDAVNRGDTERAKEILREYAKEKGYLPPEDYKGKGAWVAPSASVDRKDFRNLDAIREQVEESYDTNLYAIANGVSLAPDDYFGPMGSRYYMYNDQTGMESYYAIKKAIDSIQTQLRERGEVVRMPEIEVYRAVPDYKKKIASLQKDLDLFTFDKDGNPRVSDVSKLSKESQEDYARYKDQQEREVIDDADQLLYDTLRGAQNISDAWTVKEGMLQSGGEWVSPSLSYAKQHGGNRFDGNYKIIKEKVPADELRWDGNDIREWGFDDGREYVTKPVKNSRKNIEITYDRKLYKPKYDENGNKISGWEVGEEYLIPLSKRFNEKNPDTKYQRVYHGSPAEFDRFDSSHMGEGEGAQAHGWGHYVAVDENTGRRYADMRHYNYEVEIDGKTITNEEDLWDVPYFERELYRNIFRRFAMNDYGTFEEDLKDVIDRQRKDYEEVIQHYENLIANPEKPLVGFEDVNMDQVTAERRKQLEGYVDALEKLEELTPEDVKVRETDKKRNLYEVEIPDRVKKDTPTGVNYLDEDMWISTKEAQKFEDAMKGKTDKYVPDFVGEIVRLAKDTKLTGKKLYNELVQFLGDGKRASNMLKAIGYDGIHYFGGRDGEAYVIFDDNDLEIKNHERYQIAEYDYDENGRRTNLKFGEDNSEFDPSIFDRSREDQIDADKENEKSSPFYNAWVRYNAQNYKDDQLTLEEFINEISKRGDKEQEIYDQKMRDIGEAQNDPKMLDLQLRAVKLMEEEGQVGKKFGKNVSKEVRDRQQAEVEKKREQLVKDIFDWMYPGLKFEDATYDDQKMADQKEAEWEMLGKEDIESKLKYFKKDKNGNREAKDIKVENPDIKLEKILSSGKFDEIFTPVDRVIEWKTPQGQKGRIDRLKDPAKYKRFFEKIYDPKTKTKVEVKDVTKEVRALERYRADEQAEKERRKKEKQEEYAKKKQEEYKRLVRMKAFQRLIDMQRFEKYPFLTEEEIKNRYGFSDEEWKTITEQEEIKLPKKRGEKAISDFNKAVDDQVKYLIEGLNWQNTMKRKEAEKNLGEIGEIDVDILLGRDEEKGQKEVEEFEKIAKEEREQDSKLEDGKTEFEKEIDRKTRKQKKQAEKLTKQWNEMFRKAEEKRNERYANKEEKKIDEVKSVDEAKALTKDSRWKRTKKFWKDTTIQDLIQPISSRIEKISPRIYLEMMRFEQRIAIKQNIRMKQVEDFVKKMAQIRKSNKKDYLNITLHLLNGNVGTANQMLEKYGTSIPRQVLDEIWADAEDVGYTMNYEGFYYPRKVKDVQEFLDRFAKVENKDVQGEIDKVIKKAEEKARKRGEEFTPQQKADLINQLLMDGEVEGISLGSGHMKKRKVDSITKNMLEFYEDPVDSILQYINGMTEAIEKARFLGQGTRGEIKTLGEFIADEGISGYDADELKKLLLSRFNYAPMGEMMSKLKVSANIIHLGSPSSALSQLADVSFSLIENGLANIVQGLAKRYNLDLDALGITNRGEELKTQGKNETKWEKIQRFTFKWTGFNMMDQFGKKLLVVSTLNKLIRYAKNNDPQLRKDLSRRFDDPKMIDGVIEDLKVGKMSENVNLFLFTKLADVQPLTRTQMTRTYLQAGNWRVLYAFKTFGIKQLDYIIQKSRRELQTKPTAKALWSIVTMLGIIMLCGAGDDELKDFSMGRKYSSWIWRMIEGNDWSASQLSDRFWDNFLKLFGFTKYSIYQARTQGIKSAIEDIFFSLPGLDMFTYPLQDIQNAMGEDGLDFSQASSWQLIPIVGKYGYWWAGAGQTKQQKSLEKEKKRSTKNKSTGFTRKPLSR